MKKKFGFTLAEILITLGIIGVVAALTTPALVKNSGQAKIGPSLAKFVNTFETACEQMLTDQNESQLNDVNIPKLANYIVMTPYDSTKSYTFYDASGTNSYEVSNNADKSISQLKDGSIMVIIHNPNSSNSTGIGSYKGAIAEVLYDIDGDRAINKAGKDVFGFLIDRTGVLVPSGSNTHSYLYKNAKNYSGSLYVKEPTSCSTTGTVQDALACTGKIADNGWKAEY